MTVINTFYTNILLNKSATPNMLGYMPDAGRTVWRITYNLEKTLLRKFLFSWSEF